MTPALVTAGYRVEQALRARGVPLNDHTAAVIRALVDMGPVCGTSGETLRRLGLADSTAHWWFQKKRLPTAGRWNTLGRAIHIARAVQAGQKLSAVAAEMGFRDHSGPSALLRDTFGMGSKRIRKSHPTPEALIEGWLDREGAWR